MWPWASVVAQMVKDSPAVHETHVQSLGQEDPLEKSMAMHSRILTWRIPWTEEPPGRLYSMGSQSAGHGWLTLWLSSATACLTDHEHHPGSLLKIPVLWLPPEVWTVAWEYFLNSSQASRWFFWSGTFGTHCPRGRGPFRGGERLAFWSCFSEDLKEKPSQERSLWTASLRTNNKRRARLPVGLISLFINQSSSLPELLNTNSSQVVESVILTSWEWETLFYVFECCSQSLTLRAGTIVEGGWEVGKGGVCLKIKKKKKISFSPRSL